MSSATAGTGGSLTAGTISWFGGPDDPSSGSTTASGAPVTTPGIAVYNQQTLGGWWLVKLPNGVISLVRQTDIGPAPSTGRTFDFLYSLLPFLGYSQQNFPTNGSASGVYIGKAANIGALASSYGAGIQRALTQLGATAKQDQSLVAQIDAGRGKNTSTAVLAVDTSGSKVSAANTSGGAVSTGLTGDAANAGINVPNPLSGLGGIANAISAIWTWLTTPAKWLEILKFAGGVVLVYIAVKSLTGVQTPSVSVSKVARAVA